MSQVRIRPMGATASLDRNGRGGVVARSGASLTLAGSPSMEGFNPLELLGVTASQLRFLEVFLLFCLLAESPPLDAEEQAMAAGLPRLHGRTEPGLALDARILGAARAAVASPAPAPKRPPLRHRRWILPTSVAATVAIAAGLGWQLRAPAIQPVREGNSLLFRTCSGRCS